MRVLHTIHKHACTHKPTHSSACILNEILIKNKEFIEKCTQALKRVHVHAHKRLLTCSTCTYTACKCAQS